MKLGEALTLRAAQAQKLADMAQRINSNAAGQEGEPPAEDPVALIEEWKQLSYDHAALVLRINQTNSQSGLAELLVQREHLRRVRNLLTGAARAANPGANIHLRYMRSEIKNVSHVDVAGLTAQADQRAEEARELDTQIQERNWQIDLVS